MDINSWIFSKKYFDPREPESDVSIGKPGYWKSGDPSQEILDKNAKWTENEDHHSGTVSFFAASPSAHLTWFSQHKYFSPPIAEISLQFAGIIPGEHTNTNQMRKSLSRDAYNKLVKLWLSIIPDTKCIKKQLDYIYSDPVKFLLMINYGHDEQKMLEAGRDVKSTHSISDKDRVLTDLKERFLIDKRVPENILNKYATLSSLKRYGLLNTTILKAPRCHNPIILFRGVMGLDNDRYQFTYKNPGYRFVTNSIISTSISAKNALMFAAEFDCCMYVFYLPNNIPRLFINRTESEFLLPSGLLMEYAETDTVNRTTCFRIKVLKLVEDVGDV